MIFLPPLILPEHSEEYVVVYPETKDAETLYFPGFSVTVVPEDEPENVLGVGLFPETVMVKSDGLLLPLNTLVVTPSVPNNPGCRNGRGMGVGRLLSFWIGVFFVAA